MLVAYFIVFNCLEVNAVLRPNFVSIIAAVAMESFGLMNAMVAVASKPIKKKKKPLTSKVRMQYIYIQGFNGEAR